MRSKYIVGTICLITAFAFNSISQENKIGFFGNYGYRFVNMKDLNNELQDHINIVSISKLFFGEVKSEYIDFEELTNINSFAFGIKYKPLKNKNLDLIGKIAFGKYNGSIEFTYPDTTNNEIYSNRVEAIPRSIVVSVIACDYFKYKEFLHFNIGIGPTINFGKYEEIQTNSINDNPYSESMYEGSGMSIGVEAFLGLELFLHKNISFDLNVGYTLSKVNDIKNQDGELMIHYNSNMITNPSLIRLDFSGYYISSGLNFYIVNK